jgi:hypothetical protein
METYTVTVSDNKTIEWRNSDGKRHRKDGPAIEFADGGKHWYVDGKRHRKDGPAIEYANGTKEWWLDGKRHREDGPAIEWADGTKEWWLDGKRHREDGPAIEWADGDKSWYVNDKNLSQAQFLAHTKRKQSSCAGKVVEVDGVKYILVKA